MSGNGVPFPGQGGQQMQGVPAPVKCEGKNLVTGDPCGSERFEIGYYRIIRIKMGIMGQPDPLANAPVFQCADCGTILTQDGSPE